MDHRSKKHSGLAFCQKGTLWRIGFFGQTFAFISRLAFRRCHGCFPLLQPCIISCLRLGLVVTGFFLQHRIDECSRGGQSIQCFAACERFHRLATPGGFDHPDWNSQLEMQLSREEKRYGRETRNGIGFC